MKTTERQHFKETTLEISDTQEGFYVKLTDNETNHDSGWVDINVSNLLTFGGWIVFSDYWQGILPTMTPVKMKPDIFKHKHTL